MISKACLGLLAALFVAGCGEYVNPFVDDSIETEAISTSSVEQARTAPVVSEPRVRMHDPRIIAPEDGTVAHFPLWWQDPFEDRGSEDDQFAWTWEDYVGMPYGLSRFILNTMGWPVSFAVEPPFPNMGSDGAVSRQLLGPDHDPERLAAGGPSTPPDLLEVGGASVAGK